jgi:sulfur relay (sulfurtransferase) DsrF/TusC family protein
MSKRVVVVISEDPVSTARPVEALRIALGLCAGDHETTVVLLGNASRLLMEETDEIIDVEILEKYLPSFKHLAVPFVIESNMSTNVWSDDFSVTTRTTDEIRQLVRSADRSLIF